MSRASLAEPRSFSRRGPARCCSPCFPAWGPPPAAGSRWPSASPRWFSWAWLAAGFDRADTGYQFVERHAWIAALGVHYHLGLDGMSLLLVLLTGIVSPVALLASWRHEREARLFGCFSSCCRAARSACSWPSISSIGFCSGS